MKSHNEKGFTAYKWKPDVLDQSNQVSSKGKEVNVFQRQRPREAFEPIEQTGDEIVDNLM